MILLTILTDGIVELKEHMILLLTDNIVELNEQMILLDPTSRWKRRTKWTDDTTRPY